MRMRSKASLSIKHYTKRKQHIQKWERVDRKKKKKKKNSQTAVNQTTFLVKELKSVCRRLCTKRLTRNNHKILRI